MIILTCFLGIFYTIILSLFLIKKEKEILFNAYNMFIFMFMLIYGFLFPISYILTINGYSEQLFISIFKDINVFDVILYYFIVSIISFCIIFVFRRKSNYEKLNNMFKINADELKNKIEINKKHLMITGIILFIIGVVADYLYLKVYGSYENYLLYSRALRSGVIIIKNPFSFLIIFRGCVTFSSYIFFSLIQCKKNKVFISLLFILSFIFSMRIMYSNYGRMSFLIYFLVLIVYYFVFKSKPKYFNLNLIFKLLFLLLVFIFGIIIMGNILSRNSTENFILQINREISFIFVNFFETQKKLSFEKYRFFIDTINFPIYLLPSSIWMSKLKILTASDYVTAFIYGGIKGSSGVYGEMPVDLITLSFMQFGYITIGILPFIFSMYFCKLCNLLNKIFVPSARLMMSIYIFFVVGVETFFYADPKHIVNRCFPFIVFIIIYSVVKKVKLER